MDETNKAQCSYSIVPITVNDKETVAVFLRKFFFRDEPLNVAIELLEETDSVTKLENYCIGYLQYGELRGSIHCIKLCGVAQQIYIVKMYLLQ